MATPVQRQSVIRDVLGEGPAPSQEALIERLASAGIRTTQATLSRDLREMGVVKGPEGYRLPEGQPRRRLRGLAATGALERVLRQYAVGVQAGVGLIVIKTGVGHAQVVALELDRTPPEGVVGTVAGDDTIFLAVAHQDRVATLMNEVREMIGLEVEL